MGKTTTAKIFERFGCSIWDADEAVRRLYKKGGGAVNLIAEKFPTAIVNGAVDKSALREILAEDTDKFTELNRIIHPLVFEDRENFKKTNTSMIQVFDIPLLFELGIQNEFDATVCVLTTKEEQRRRVLSRQTMNEAEFVTILDQQMSAEIKAAKSDFVVRTDTLEMAEQSVKSILEELRRQEKNA